MLKTCFKNDFAFSESMLMNIYVRKQKPFLKWGRGMVKIRQTGVRAYLLTRQQYDLREVRKSLNLSFLHL